MGGLLAAAAALLLAAMAAVRAPMRGWDRPLALTLSFVFVAVEGLLFSTFRAFSLDLEHDSAILWGGVAVLAMVVTGAASAWRQRTAGAELVAAIAVAMLVAGAGAMGQAERGLASAPIRALLVAGPVLLLCGYFGSSLGFLIRGSGETDAQWGYESKVGRRFLLSKSSPVVSTVTTISVVGVMLGVAAVLVSLAVLAGFENDLREKIIGAHAHALLQRGDERPFVLSEEQRGALEQTTGVAGYAPVIEGEVAIASRSNYTGGLVLGVDPAQSQGVITILERVVSGSVDPLSRELMPRAPAGEVKAVPADDFEDEFPAPAALPNIVIGAEMARSLAVQTGDTVRLLSPTLSTLTPVGLAPKSLGFRVAGIFYSKMYEYDAKLAFISSATARSFFELPERSITGMMIQVDDPERSDRIGEALLTGVGGAPFRVLDWKSRNQTLFAALKLERIVAFVVLAFIILVASFSIVNTLTMSVIEKRKEIAILKTMGARDVGIMKIFLVQGLTVGAFGIGLGVIVGLMFIGALESFGFWIPDDVYYIDSLPVHLEPLDGILVAFAALLIVWNFAVFPALRGSRLAPVEGLRDG